MSNSRRFLNNEAENRNRARVCILLICILIICLIGRFAYIQLYKSSDYSERASGQHISNVEIDAKRGNITDRNGNKLAVSITCYTMYAWPNIINENYTEEEINEKVTALAKILNKDENAVRKLLTKGNGLNKVASGITEEGAIKIEGLKFYGTRLHSASKRSYPMGNFASHLLGSITEEGDGRTGVELQYNKELSGTPGNWIYTTDSNGNKLAYGTEKKEEPIAGANLVLTIDNTIQYYAETAIANAMKETKAKRITCMVMDPKTGEILAMATAPNFNPEKATLPIGKTAQEEFAKLSNEEQLDYLCNMWNNPVVSDVYEPGSVFKLVTASGALEEGVITPKSTFYCESCTQVNGVWLHCANGVKHLNETLAQAVGNSCNVALVEIAQKMKPMTFFSYIKKYGLTEKTGIDLPGEGGSIVKSFKNINNVDYATNSYGQGIAVTPIQMLTAVASIGNDGVLMKPHVVKEIVDDNGNVVKKIEPEKVRRVVSEKTASETLKLMEYVVSDGGAQNAQIKGYRIGGKTGTANIASSDGGYSTNVITSFVSLAPIDNPELAVIAIVDSPKGIAYGSTTAAPIVKEVLEKTFKYLKIPPVEDVYLDNPITVPNVKGKTVSEAEAILKNSGLNCKVIGTNLSNDITVVDQFPKSKQKVEENQEIYIYTE